MADYFVRYGDTDGFSQPIDHEMDVADLSDALRLIAEMESGNLRYLFIEAGETP